MGMPLSNVVSKEGFGDQWVKDKHFFVIVRKRGGINYCVLCCKFLDKAQNRP